MARLAFISMHTSPADLPGSGDAGGMNVVERAQAVALAALGHEVELITRRASPDAPDLVELAPGVTLRHIAAGPAAPLAKSAIDAFIPEFAAGLARLEAYELVHSHHWMSGVAALPVAREWGVPHVQSFHSVAALPGASLDEGERPESPARVAGEASVAQHSDAVVAISAAEARTVIERCGADPDRVHIVSPGVDGDLFRPLRPGEERWDGAALHGTSSGTQPAGMLVGPQSAGAPPVRASGSQRSARPRPIWPRGFVLFAARLQPLKGPALAIAAMAELAPEIRPQLVVAGDASADFADYAAELRALVDDLGLRDDVTFIGPQSRADLATLLRSARVVLVPSHSETFGLIALEAASSGTPVIAASAGGLREAVAHLETGHLMDSRRPEDWGCALRHLLTHPRQLATMGVVARVHARRFDWAFAAHRLSGLYARLMGKSHYGCPRASTSASPR